MKPKISIITITLNSERYLEQTITSIISQTYANLEYIIIDGGSSDGTLKIIQKYKSKIDKWISEPDNGIADAMNKGVKLSTGDYILFIHSDDYLIDQKSIEKAVEHMNTPHDIFLFDIYLEKNETKLIYSPNYPIFLINFKMPISHQSCFCSKRLFKQIGGFDINLQIDMDYDFFLRAYRAGTKFSIINNPFSVMRLTGISSRLDWNSLKMRFLEEKQVHFKNCPNVWMKYIYRLYWCFYLPYRKIKYLINEN